MLPKFYYFDGTILDYLHHKKILHRLDGPAIEYTDGSKTWYQNNKLHRFDGPAVIYPDGKEEYWINGVRISRLPSKQINLPDSRFKYLEI